ncbi:MAG TPA: polysaccharide lyase family protein, partial [Puia sp.]
MKNRIGYLLFCFFFGIPTLKAQQLLWQIGKPDDGLNEFALAPDKGASFVKDGFFVVGRSDPQKDWPYSHPGPRDAWAGGRKHTYTIVFGMENAGVGDSCALQVKLLDVGPAPVKLDISVNGQVYSASLPEGADGAIYGDVSKGKKQAFAVKFPARLLKKGENTITITNGHGSWMVYDWLGLEAPAGNRSAAVRAGVSLTDYASLPFIAMKDGRGYQPVQLSFINTGDGTDVSVSGGGLERQKLQVASGLQVQEVLLPEVSKDSTVQLIMWREGKVIGQKDVVLHPVRKITVYVLPHSHNDIGYTEIQSDVEKKQINNLLKGIDFARRTKDYPAGARFVWNLEGVYAADLFLQRMNEQQKQDFYAAVRDGGVAFNGMYLNTLTGLCRPEELVRLFGRATQLAQQCGVKVDAAMISDVPGYTWGTVTAMAQAGIKYFSAAPNYFDRIGNILVQWEDKPFYWVSPSGKDKLLVWIPYRGYALSHGLPGLSEGFAAEYMNQLTKVNYPYDITYVRW